MGFMQVITSKFKRSKKRTLSAMHHHHHASMPLARNKVFNERPPTGFAAYARAARRYNFDTPTVVGRKGVVFRKSRPTTGDSSEAEVPANDIQNDLEYVVPVTIGTPGVTLNLDFDTGSSDLWVWSSELTTKTSGHNIYNPKKSSTAKVLAGATWNISYGDGSSASGNVYTDNVKIGSASIPGQAVELAEKLSAQFAQGEGSDGLLGLAWPSLNTVQPQPQKTPVENMIDNGIITQGLFTVALDKGDSNGFYTFGIIDAAKAGVNDGDIQYTPIDNSQGFWMFDSGSATINGQTIDRSGNAAIADTGTTLCLVDDDTVQQIYATIPGARLDESQGGYVYPSDATVPVVQFAVGDQLFTINPEDFAFADAGDGTTFGGVSSFYSF